MYGSGQAPNNEADAAMTMPEFDADKTQLIVSGLKNLDHRTKPTGDESDADMIDANK